MVADNNAIL